MKLKILSLIMGLSFLTSAAHALELRCTTETNSIIIANIGYNKDYVINQFTIDGLDFTTSASYKASRDGYSVIVKKFKKGEDLTVVMTGDNSYFTVGAGRQQSMRCVPLQRK